MGGAQNKWKGSRFFLRTDFLAAIRLLCSLLFGLLLLVCSPSYARFDRILVDDGLSNSSIESLAQDAQGYVWVGTQNGLNRYDGYSIKSFYHESGAEQGLADNWIWSLQPQGRGLWIGTKSGGLHFYPGHGERFERYVASDNPNDLADNDVRAITLDDDGGVWVGTPSGLSYLSPERDGFRSYTTEHGLLSNNVRSLFWHKGYLWVGTLGGGLQRLDPRLQHFEAVNFGADVGVRAIAAHGDSVWVGTIESGVYQVDIVALSGKRLVQHRVLRSNRTIMSLLTDTYGDLWIGYVDGGLLKVEFAENEVVTYAHDPTDPTSLGNDHVRALFQDRTGVLWVGTHYGLCKWNISIGGARNYFNNGTHTRLSGNVVMSFAEHDRDKLWVSYHSKGIDLVDLQEGAVRNFRHDAADPQTLSDDRVYSLAQSEDGYLWAGTMAGGLNRLHIDTGAVTRFAHDPSDPLSLSDNDVPAVLAESDAIWVATYGGGLNRFDRKTQTFAAYRHKSDSERSISSDYVLDVLRTKDGALWVATYDEGINQLTPAGFVRIKYNSQDAESLSSNDAWLIHEDPLGNLWVGTASTGLNLWSAADRAAGRVRFSHINRSHGLPSNVIYGMQGDAVGNLWVRTDQGVARVAQDGAVTKYGRMHGFQGTAYNHRSHGRLSDGRLLFGGMRGFDLLDPSGLRAAIDFPEVQVTGVSILDQGIDWRSQLTQQGALQLRHSDVIVNIDFVTLEYTEPESVRYEHRLLGFEEAWTVDSGGRRATYTNLSPGSYTFQVRATNYLGGRSRMTALPVVVLPPPWATWWARVMYVIALAIVCLWVYRAYRHRMVVAAEISATNKALRVEIEERQEQDRAVRSLERRVLEAQKMEALGTLSRGVAHDFNNILGAIQGYAELAKLDLPQNESPAQYLEQLETSVRRARELIHSILTFGRQAEQSTRPCLLGETVEEVLRLVKPNLPSNVKLDIDIEEPLSAVASDPTQLNRLLLNLCTNAHQAMTPEGGMLTIRGRELGLGSLDNPSLAAVELTVSDTGRGMTEDVVARVFEPFYTTRQRLAGTGLGLSVVHGIVSQLGGDISVTSEVEAGSTFTVRLPVWTEDLQLPSPAGESLPKGQQETILLVDDELSLVSITGAMLRKLGYRVITATDGQSALDTFVENRRRIDLVITDQMMPLKLGSDLALAIHDLDPSIPVILMSGGGDYSSTPHITSFISKPFAQIELAQCIRSAIANPPTKPQSGKPNLYAV